MTPSTSSPPRIFIVERYQYRSKSQQLPQKEPHSQHDDVESANEAADSVFQQLMADHFSQFGYLETKGIDARDGLFRGAFLLAQKDSGNYVERIGVCVRRDLHLPRLHSGAGTWGEIRNLPFHLSPDQRSTKRKRDICDKDPLGKEPKRCELSVRARDCARAPCGSAMDPYADPMLLDEGCLMGAAR
ncbi:hypothetical protein EJ05DRAFT_471508 [Pseudovirgaria hyperparasitica]|uniref:Uncharacterized protein n=1 Tax=Pseudovirgaria hyperparasitica TaxID=470096 RepID=A0A6A6WJB3_9PEZI|nr:uncharacterized protein EJ05DRAFT_471508 [Pseudovirgaria hyperparasitica]KAF2762499.1 hypothetical protein EJ05DRAFT_471508 [Pseudovirgaria hyperparasitica]